MDIIYHNMNSLSDFRTLRTNYTVTIESMLQQVARHVAGECYQVISLSASERTFVVVLSTELSKEELRRRGFP
jgi:hypothetical protein